MQPAERRYPLTPRVAAEAASLPPPGSAAFWRAVESADRSGPGRLRAETLVIALRQLKALGDEDGVRRVATVLVLRWEPWVRNASWRLFPRSADDREDFMNGVYLELLEHLLDPGKGFWEANFVHALRLLAFSVARPLTQARRTLSERDLRDDDDDGGDAPSPLEQADPQADTPGAAFVREALGYLDEPYRSAVYYRFVEGWPVVNKRPEGPSIARLLGVSDRQVQTYVQRGLAQLRAHYGGGEGE